MKRTKENSRHYFWGNNCSGWHLVKSKKLSVIQELMPPNTEEKRHYHNFSEQFFYIIKGIAIFEIEDKIMEVESGKGIHILPKIKHKIKNDTENELEFLVISQPPAQEDRLED